MVVTQPVTQGPMRFNLQHAQKAETHGAGNPRHDREGREDPPGMRRLRAELHASQDSRSVGELGRTRNTQRGDLGARLRASVQGGDRLSAPQVRHCVDALSTSAGATRPSRPKSMIVHPPASVPHDAERVRLVSYVTAGAARIAVQDCAYL